MRTDYDNWLQADYQQQEAEREAWQERYEALLDNDYSPSNWNNAMEALGEERATVSVRHAFTRAMEDCDYAVIGMMVKDIAQRYWETRAAEAADAGNE